MRRAITMLMCSVVVLLSGILWSQESKRSDIAATSTTKEAPLDIDVKAFQKGKTWHRIVSTYKNLAATVLTTGKMEVDYSVIEGFVDGECPTGQIVIEVKRDGKRSSDENNPFRIVLEKDGRYKCTLFRRGDTWHEYGGVSQPKEPAVVVVRNDTFQVYHVFLPLPLEWKDAKLSFPTNGAGKAVVETKVHGDQLLVTCVIEKALPASMQTTNTQGAGDIPAQIERTFHLVYQKGDPWPVSMSSDIPERLDVFMMTAKEETATRPSAVTSQPVGK